MASALAFDRSTPFTQAGRSALQKILAVLREVDAESTRELAGRVRLFGSASEGHRPLPALEQAIVERKVVEIDYVDKHGEGTTRTVEPVSVMGVQAHWYLWGFCRLREAPRVFRLDRLRSASVSEEVAPDRGLDPADIELPELINRGILGDFRPQTSDQEFRKH